MKHTLQAIIFFFLCFGPLACSKKEASEPSAPRLDRQLIGEELQFGRKAAKYELWHEAIFRWEKVIKADKENVQALNNLAVAFEAVGDYESARKNYERALEIDEDIPALRNNYKRFLHFYKRHMKNRERLEKAKEKGSQTGTDLPNPPADDSDEMIFEEPDNKPDPNQTKEKKEEKDHGSK